MEIPEILHFASIGIEVLVVIIAVFLATVRKKQYGWLIALTFTIYVFYDTARTFPDLFPPVFLSVIFLVASASIFVAVWKMYKES
jgi:hypothetical protein